MVTLETILELTDQLSTVDKIRLIECLARQIEHEIKLKTPRKSLRGLWRGMDITEEEIQAVRQEMWRSFPQDDSLPETLVDENALWSQFSLQAAMRGMEEEENDDYQLTDVKEFWRNGNAEAYPQ
jgi:hypothetical protein